MGQDGEKNQDHGQRYRDKMRQCTCGRSKTYPYCDNTHKVKSNKESDPKETKDSEEKTNLQ